MFYRLHCFIVLKWWHLVVNFVSQGKKKSNIIPISRPQLNCTFCTHCSLRNHNFKLGFSFASLFPVSLSKALHHYEPLYYMREIRPEGGLPYSGQQNHCPLPTVMSLSDSPDTARIQKTKPYSNKAMRTYSTVSLLKNFYAHFYLRKANAASPRSTQTSTHMQQVCCDTACGTCCIQGWQEESSTSFTVSVATSGKLSFVSLSIYTSWGLGF